jgi:hypothetical protein
MIMTEVVKELIEKELKLRNKSIRNQNAIDSFLKVFAPGAGILKDILTGSKKAVEHERQILTIDIILDLVIKIDDKLSQPTEGKRIGILNTGKYNSYVNCGFGELDIGILDKGESTLVKDCDFT